jgi:hypothetical protein
MKGADSLLPRAMGQSATVKRITGLALASFQSSRSYCCIIKSRSSFVYEFGDNSLLSSTSGRLDRASSRSGDVLLGR